MDSSELKAFLSQLQTSQDGTEDANAAPIEAPDHASIMALLETLQPLQAEPNYQAQRSTAPAEEPSRRSLTFAQALPVLGALSKNTFAKLLAVSSKAVIGRMTAE